MDSGAAREGNRHRLAPGSRKALPTCPTPRTALIVQLLSCMLGVQAFLWNTMGMGQQGGAHPALPRIFDFGDDEATRRWMCSAFSNCEMRSVLADFAAPSDAH